MEKGKGSVVHVPPQIAAWMQMANRFQKAAGKRKYTTQQVLQAILDYVAQNGLEDFLSKIDPDLLTDTRGRPKG